MANIADLEGWLLKRKKKSGLNFLGGDTKRWFRLQKLSGDPDAGDELALCYFQTNKSKEAKGWIFLSDIFEIDNKEDSFVIHSPARVMVLEAQTKAEHNLWLYGIASFCPNAKLNFELPEKYRNGLNRADDKKSAMKKSHSQQSKQLQQQHDIEERKSFENKEDASDKDEDDRRANRKQQDHKDHGDVDESSAGDRHPRSSGVINVHSLKDRAPPRDDHRLVHVPNDVSASKNMRDHIVGEGGNRRRNSNRSENEDENKDRDEPMNGNKSRHNDVEDNELDSLDINEPVVATRRDRLKSREEASINQDQDRKEKEETRPQQNNNNHSNQEENNKKSTKKVVNMPAGPPPRRVKDLADDDDDEYISSSMNRLTRGNSNTIDDVLRTSTTTKVHLHDDDDIEMDLKAEKWRYNNRSSSNSHEDHADGVMKPPRPPTKSSSTTLRSESSKETSKGNSSPPSNSIHDDWDDEDSDEESEMKSAQQDNKNKITNHKKNQEAKSTPTIAGPKPDNNWLEENFDD